MRWTLVTLSLALGLVAPACTKVPTSTCAPVGEFPGPEDFDLVVRDGRTQLIVSATERRDPAAASANGFWQIDWGAEPSIRQLEVHGRDGCWLAPHGIATAELEPGRWQLWAVMHYELPAGVEAPPACAGLVNAVEHFELRDDGLHFIERLTGPELTNPNDLDALPDGRLWISNNPPWPGGKGMAGDVLFRRAKGQVVHYAPGAGFSVAARDLVFPNGIHVTPGAETLWVAASAGDVFELGLDDAGHEQGRARTRAAPRATLDNLLMDDEGQLWIAGHPKGLAFIRHARDATKHAPTVAYRVDPSTGEIEAIAQWTKGEVEAGASAIVLGGELVLAQVFASGLRRCVLP